MTFSNFYSYCWASQKISGIRKYDDMEMGNHLVYNILAAMCHLLWIAFWAVKVMEVNWVVNNNHIDSLKWRRRTRQGERSLLSTVGTGRGHLNICAGDWHRLCVLESVLNRWTDVPFYFIFSCNCLDMFYKVPKYGSNLCVGEYCQKNPRVWWKRFLTGSEKVQKKPIIKHL